MIGRLKNRLRSLFLEPTEDQVHTGPQEQQGYGRYNGIQVLRAIAALMIVVVHSLFYTRERMGRSPLPFDWVSGVSGVDIFFVISGFVMVHTSRKLVGKKDGWKDFALRRLFRIVPLYWLATCFKIAVAAVAPNLTRNANLSWGKIISSLLFLPTHDVTGGVLPARNIDGLIEPVLGVGWTLIYEMFFYFLFTVALYLRTNVLYFVGAVLAVCTVVGSFRQVGWSPYTMYLDSIVLEFFYGMLIAHMCESKVILKRGVALGILILSSTLLVGCLLPPGPRCTRFGIYAFFICWSMASLERWIHPYISKRALFLADASYAIYICHPLITPLVPFLLVKMHYFNPWISVVLSIITGTTFSCLVYQYVDARIMGRSKTIIKILRSSGKEVLA